MTMGHLSIFLGLPHWVYILQKHFPRAIYYNFYRCDSLVMQYKMTKQMFLVAPL